MRPESIQQFPHLEAGASVLSMQRISLASQSYPRVPMLHAHFVKGAKDTSPGATIGIGIAVALFVPISAVILYNNWTSWDWSAAQPQAQQQDMAHSMEEAIIGLERPGMSY